MSTVVLAVDDEPLVRHVLKSMLSTRQYEVVLAENAAQALDVLRTRHVDLMLTDVRMTPMDGVELLKQAREIDPQLPVVLMTAYATISTAVAAMKLGAFDYITKPFRVNDLMEIVEHALDPAHAVSGAKDEPLPAPVSYRFERIIAESVEMQRVCQDIERAAVTSAPSLLCGEIGTGKSTIAEAIHARSSRPKDSFVVLNCAETPAPVIELRLFGAEKEEGAQKLAGPAEGLLQPGGTECTILLDEIMMMPPGLLERLTLYVAKGLGGKAGGNAPSKVGLILAADATLEELSQMGGFTTLMSRISGVRIEIKPLRERKRDILPLLSHFFYQQIGDWSKLPVLSGEAHEILMQYPWPGNITELAGAVEHIFPQMKDGRITKHILPIEILEFAETGVLAKGQNSVRADYRAKHLKSFLLAHLPKKND